MFYSTATARIDRLELAYPSPGYPRAYAGLFGIDPTFGAVSTGLVFDADYLRLAALDADARVFAESVGRCRREIEYHSADSDTVAAVEQFLWSNPGKLWSVDEIAGALHTSTRTLLRRLRARQVTYQGLRDVVLKQQAELYLGSMSVADTAAALGFADESSFRRSFKRWSGLAPGEFRRGLSE